MLIEGFCPAAGPGNLASPLPAVLAGIVRPGTHIAIWPRTLPGPLMRDLGRLAARAPFTATAEDTPETALDALVAALPGPAPLDLFLDMLHLATVFTQIAGAPRLRMRLEAIDGPGCHLWHADAVGLRLLCTYRGAGTEWLARPGGAQAARLLNRAGEPGLPIQRLGTGDVALMKGEAYPGNRGAGCIHRAPPRTAKAPPRLLLCLDEAGRIPLE
jgi:hypothetical protein